MSLLIKGMKMPETCIDCELTYCDDDFGKSCIFTDVPCLNLGRQNNCTLVDVPTPHGRLVDQEKVMSAFGDFYDAWIDQKGKITQADVDKLFNKLTANPTVVEAED